MTFLTDARTKFVNKQPKPVEPAARGEIAATKLQIAIGDRKTDFIGYNEFDEPVVKVDDALFAVRTIRDIEETQTHTVRCDLLLTCTNPTTPHVHRYPVVHEGMVDGDKPTSSKQRDDFFLTEVGRVLVTNPKCPTCGSDF